MYKKALLLAGLFAFAMPASASVFVSFVPGVSAAAAAPGLTLLTDFQSDPGFITGTYSIHGPVGDSTGAPPAFGSTGNFLSVLGGESASIALDNVTAFAFNWGSLDYYNTLTFTGSAGSTVLIPGSPGFMTGSDGNQILPGTNGALYVYGTDGDTFSGLTLSSTQNSFEIDNLRVAAVPEPATWGMLILGIAAIGMSMRRRRTSVSFA